MQDVLGSMIVQLPASGAEFYDSLLACVLWSVECGNALRQSRVAPVG